MRVPAATYRLQFRAGFGFDDARALVPFLDALGVSDVYASPILRARSGSAHGYDVTDPSTLNPELGSREAFDALSDELRSRGMGLLLDIVPNHMAMGAENPWWMDVLEHGRASRFATFFDIDWGATLGGKVLVPVLGAPYAEILERGELNLALGPEGLSVRYYDHRFPLDPATYGPVLAHALDGTSDPTLAREIRRLLRAVDRIPARRLTGRPSVERRGSISEDVKRRLWALHQGSPEVRAHLERTVDAWGGRPRGEAVLERLDALIAEQAYLLSFWRAAAEEIDYRRFFDISELVSVRMQEPEVFERVHALPLALHAEGRVTGLRIDHVDGLWDPLEYLRRLQDRMAPGPGAARRRTGRAGSQPGYVVVEKILAEDESLPPDWPVAGTTGYDFLNAVNGLFVSGPGLASLRDHFARATGRDEPFGEVVRAQKGKVMEQLFGSEVGALGSRLQALARADRRGRDLTLNALTSAIVEVTAALPVYRTYVREPSVRGPDREHIERAVAEARGRVAPEAAAAVDFLRRVLLFAPPVRKGWLPFVMRWQQFTGPVMAKGFEDTALYRYTPLVSLNDVGGDPGVAPASPPEFHRRMRDRARRWPGALNTTSTHDTKRSEDVRARIDVLSEMAEEWIERVERWRRWNAGRRREVDGVPAPDPAEELLLYQTLVGVWPLQAEGERDVAGRVREYMRKALREGKEHTTWFDPNEEYEEAVDRYVASVLSTRNRRFREDFLAFQQLVARHGALNALAQTLVKATAPGVPDLYRGTEVWDFSLVDPDNRRPVDFAARAALLRELDAREREDREGLLADLLAGWRDGRVKAWTLSRALRVRRANPELFSRGSHVPLDATGTRADRVLAFARRRRSAWALVAVPRLTVGLGDADDPPLGRVWGATALALPAGAPREWEDALTGQRVEAGRAAKGDLRLADVFAAFPVALLTATP